MSRKLQIQHSLLLPGPGHDTAKREEEEEEEEDEEEKKRIRRRVQASFLSPSFTVSLKMNIDIKRALFPILEQGRQEASIDD